MLGRGAFCCRPPALSHFHALSRNKQRSHAGTKCSCPLRGPRSPFIFFYVSFSPRWIVSLVYWAVSFPAAGAAADAVCRLLAETTRSGAKARGERGREREWKNKIKHRDQLICTVINREETLQRSARRGVNPAVLLLNAPTWQGPFIWLMDYILRVWSLLKHPAQRGNIRDRPARQTQPPKIK